MSAVEWNSLVIVGIAYALWSVVAGNSESRGWLRTVERMELSRNIKVELKMSAKMAKISLTPVT